MKVWKKIVSVVLVVGLLFTCSFSTLASYEDSLSGLGNFFNKAGSALDKADKGDTSGALTDYFGALGDLANTAAEMSKTTVLEDVQAYEEELDNFIKYMDIIDDKIKEQNTSEADKKKIAKVLGRITEKMKNLVKE